MKAFTYMSAVGGLERLNYFSRKIGSFCVHFKIGQCKNFSEIVKESSQALSSCSTSKVQCHETFVIKLRNGKKARNKLTSFIYN